MLLRTKELFDLLEPALDERKQEIEEKLEILFEQSKSDFGKRLIVAIEKCESQAKLLQKQNKKGESRLVCITFLISDMLNGEYNLQISLHDQRSLIDDTECVADFTYTPIGQIFEQEITFYHDYLYSKALFFHSYEITLLKQELLYLLYDWVKAYFIRLFSDLDFLTIWTSSNLPQLDEVSYGYYLNNQQSIFSILRGETK